MFSAEEEGEGNEHCRKFCKNDNFFSAGNETDQIVLRKVMKSELIE